MSDRQIIAVSLLSEQELRSLGASFNRVWPIDDSHCFDGLLQAIDEAERER